MPFDRGRRLKDKVRTRRKYMPGDKLKARNKSYRFQRIQGARITGMPFERGRRLKDRAMARHKFMSLSMPTMINLTLFKTHRFP